MSQRLSSAIKPASQLRQRYYGDGEVIEYAYNILCGVEEAIRRALDNNFSEATVELPTIFEIGQMTLASAQKHVYWRITEELENKGYTIKFEYSGGSKANTQKVHMNISWLTTKDKDYDDYISNELSKRAV